MNFLSGQDDFFQTANQPISVQHLSQPYNKEIYFAMLYIAKFENNIGRSLQHTSIARCKIRSAELVRFAIIIFVQSFICLLTLNKKYRTTATRNDL